MCVSVICGEKQGAPDITLYHLSMHIVLQFALVVIFLRGFVTKINAIRAAV